jgi:uncharacterized delta-60 repeat protein
LSNPDYSCTVVGKYDLWRIADIFLLRYICYNLKQSTKRKKIMKKHLLTTAFAAGIISTSLYAQPGAPDPTFSTDGMVITAVSPAEDYGNSLVIQPDGKILVGGFAKIGADNQFALCRYNTDGNLDNTFSTDGMLTTPAGTFAGGAGMALQPDGKILLGGYGKPGANLDFVVVRYNSDGSIDNTFSGDGIASAAVGAGLDVGSCMALQTDGKIIVAGKTNNGTNNDFGLVRFNADGTMDAGFGTAGVVTTAFPGGAAEPRCMAIQSDGKIIVAGLCNTAGSPYAIARYNTDGTLDNTFDSDGKLSGFYMAGGSSVTNAIAILADGKILVGGEGRSAASGSDRDFAIVKLNTDGTTDASFGTAGVVVTNFDTEHDNLNALIVQPDGKIVTGGYAYTGTTLLEFALVRYNADGSVDGTFGAGGKVVTEMGPGGNQIMALALQADGKIVAAGSVNAGATADFALARYLVSGSSSNIGSANTDVAQMVVYPNPAQNTIMIQYETQTPTGISIDLVAADGRKIESDLQHEKHAAGNYTRSINISQDVPNGVYFIVLTTATGTTSAKISLQR